MSFPTVDFGKFKVYYGLQGSCSDAEWKQAEKIMESAPQLAADLAALRAENAKLREALQELLEPCKRLADDFVARPGAYIYAETGAIKSISAIARARAALA